MKLGVQKWTVICDKTNNSAEDIEQNMLHVSLCPVVQASVIEALERLWESFDAYVDRSTREKKAFRRRRY